MEDQMEADGSAVGLHRLGLVEYEVAYITLLAGLAVALLGVLIAIAAFVVIWNEGLRGLGRALAALLIGVAVLAWPAFEFVRGAMLPAISDVTTDPSDLLSDIHGSAEYRANLVAVMARRAVAAA